MQKARKIIADLKKSHIKPIYFLHGEEPYFIDVISDYIEKNILSEEEKEFNQTVLYGRDVTVDEIISTAKRFPMMAKYQVVIVKEAQDLSRQMNGFTEYFKNPQASTILVLCYKYKKADGRKAYTKAAKKGGVLYESQKLYENHIPGFITNTLKNDGYEITEKAKQMLVEFLGADLGKINNELEKLRIIVPKEQKITPEIIEQNIGISKDFNVFELQKALGYADFKKAYQIIDYFGQNPKEHPILGTLPMLFRYFKQLLTYHGLKDKSKHNVAKKLGTVPFFVKDYTQGARTYSMKKCSHAIDVLRDIDAKVKGVGAANVSESDLLKEMLVRIAR